MQQAQQAQTAGQPRTPSLNVPRLSQIPESPSSAAAQPSTGKPSDYRMHPDPGNAPAAVSQHGNQGKPRTALLPLAVRMAMLTAQGSVQPPANASKQTSAAGHTTALQQQTGLQLADGTLADAAGLNWHPHQAGQAAEQLPQHLAQQLPGHRGAVPPAMHQTASRTCAPFNLAQPTPNITDQQNAEPLQDPHSHQQQLPDGIRTAEVQIPEEEIPEAHPDSPAWLADSIQSLQQYFRVSKAEISSQDESAMLGKQIAFALLDRYVLTTAAGLDFLLQPGLHAGR